MAVPLTDAEILALRNLLTDAKSNYTSSHSGLEIDTAIDCAVTAIQTAKIGTNTVTKNGTELQLPSYPTAASDIGAAPVSHSNDNGIHVTPNQKTTWDSKAEGNHNHNASQISGLPTTLPANGGNADTVNGKHASDLTLQSDFLACTTNTGAFLNDALLVSLSDKNGVYNKPALVSTSRTGSMPPNCGLGVRHVQYVDHQNIGVYIYGKDTQNTANIWGNYYTMGRWTGWESLKTIDNVKTGFCQTLASFSNTPVVGYGRVSARKVGNTLWLVSGRTGISRENAYTADYGLSIKNIGNALGLTLNGNADLAKASKATYYNINGAIDTDLTGYGGCFEHTNNHYKPARYHNTSGSVGGWSANSLPEGGCFDFDIYLMEV